MKQVTPSDIKKYREQNELSQQEMADLVGVTRELISQLESGKKPISRSSNIMLEKIIFGSGDEIVTNNTKTIETVDNLLALMPEIPSKVGSIQELMDIVNERERLYFRPVINILKKALKK